MDGQLRYAVMIVDDSGSEPAWLDKKENGRAKLDSADLSHYGHRHNAELVCHAIADTELDVSLGLKLTSNLIAKMMLIGEIEGKAPSRLHLRFHTGTKFVIYKVMLNAWNRVELKEPTDSVIDLEWTRELKSPHLLSLPVLHEEPDEPVLSEAMQPTETPILSGD